MTVRFLDSTSEWLTEYFFDKYQIQILTQAVCRIMRANYRFVAQPVFNSRDILKS